MSKADEMFKELGYEKIDEDIIQIKYLKEIRKGIGDIQKFYIRFWLKSKKYSAELFAGLTVPNVSYLSMQELQAINEKCKELGWL